MKSSRQIVFKVALFTSLITAWLAWDITMAEKERWPHYKSFKLLKEFDAVTSATTKVAIVRSDDAELASPISIDDASIDYDQIEAMVRRAIEQAGGFDWVIEPGNMVLLKPNIVDPETPGTGEITDVRVIKALIKIIDEIGPGTIEIVIGEGSPREMDYELAYSSRTSPRWQKLWDVAGYQNLLADEYLEGISFRLSNLNGSPPEDPWQDLVLVDVPGGGLADPQGGQYYIHKDVLDADVFITVPVMKIHDPGITVALKNQIGLAPSTMYGFSKTAGVPQDNHNHKLIHGRQAPKWWTDKEIVDLCNIAQIQYVVVDAIACLESQKSAIRSGGKITNLERMNMIVAGADPVAVDHVCTRLMCLNPDDIEHITLAEKIGLGTNDPNKIEIVGADIESTKRPFKKQSSPDGRYGQSNRTWLLNGPFAINGISDPMEYDFIGNEVGTTPKVGQDNWSDAVYFNDDRIDLKDFFNLSSKNDVVSYAFSYFDAPHDQDAELWIGSDEALKIYINGELVYNYNGTRTLGNDDFINEKVKANIKAGENRLLVKSLHKFGRYDFCLNICEPERNSSYSGNRIWGLVFKTESSMTDVQQAEFGSQHTFQLYNAYPNPFNPTTMIRYRLEDFSNVTLAVFNMRGQLVKTLVQSSQPAGIHKRQWNADNDFGERMSSGVYFYKLSVQSASKEFVETRKLVLMK
jgi:uncharacterized protein (DUF362 family)